MESVSNNLQREGGKEGGREKGRKRSPILHTITDHQIRLPATSMVAMTTTSFLLNDICRAPAGALQISLPIHGQAAGWREGGKGGRRVRGKRNAEVRRSGDEERWEERGGRDNNSYRRQAREQTMEGLTIAHLTLFRSGTCTHTRHPPPPHTPNLMAPSTKNPAFPNKSPPSVPLLASLHVVSRACLATATLPEW